MRGVDLYKSGRKFQDKGEFDDAVEMYVKCTEDFPNSEWARYSREQLREIKEKNSIDYISEFQNYSTANATIQSGIDLYKSGKKFQDNGEHDKAKKMYTQCINDFPKSEWARYSREQLQELIEKDSIDDFLGIQNYMKTDDGTRIFINNCRNCGVEIKKGQAVCISCGFEPHNGTSYCQNCGKETKNGQKICIGCGFELLYPLEKTKNQNINNIPEDSPNFGIAFLSFLIPIVGIILYLVWMDQKPLKSKSAIHGVLTSAFIWLFLFVTNLL